MPRCVFQSGTNKFKLANELLLPNAGTNCIQSSDHEEINAINYYCSNHHYLS